MGEPGAGSAKVLKKWTHFSQLRLATRLHMDATGEPLRTNLGGGAKAFRRLVETQAHERAPGQHSL